jgi:chromosome segregation ATPase
MSDASQVARSLRERLGTSTEDRLGKALSELLENPLLTGAIGRAFDAREKAVQAQEVAMGALNIPSAADIERLTRRLRSVSHRLEGIEDGVERLDRALSPASVDRSEIAQRLSAIEEQLQHVTDRLDRAAKPHGGAKPARAGANASAGKAKAKARTSAGGAKPAKA